MQRIVAAMIMGLTMTCHASGDLEVTDPRAIQAFLADPQTHSYDVHDPTTWRSFRKVLQYGTKRWDGSCTWPWGVSTPGSYVSFATEIAVNKARCESLVLEGDPGGGPQRQAGADRAERRVASAQPARDETARLRPQNCSGKMCPAPTRALALAPAATPAYTPASYVSHNVEITDPRAIQAFLAEPDTYSYNVKDPTTWKSFRKVLQHGTKQSDGSCAWPWGVSTPGSYVSFATEIAVNKVRCESLVLEGNPGGGPRPNAQRRVNTQVSPSGNTYLR